MDTKNIKTAIENAMQQLQREEAKFDGATPEVAVEIEKVVRKLKRDIKNLQDAYELSKAKIQPTDKLTNAKLFAFELFEKALQEGVDMSSDDGGLIAADRLNDAIEKLEMIKECSGSGALSFPNAEHFTVNLQKYIDDSADNISKVMKEIKGADAEIERIAAALEDAKAAGNAEGIMEYGDSLEDAKKKREYMQPILDNAMARETFPMGVISQEWENVANIYKHEWYVRLEIVKAAAALYHSACSELDNLSRELKAVRYNLQTIARENGSQENITKNNQIITAGATREDTMLMVPDENGSLYRTIFHNRSELL